jgi:hypothetical protein
VKKPGRGRAFLLLFFYSASWNQAAGAEAAFEVDFLVAFLVDFLLVLEAGVLDIVELLAIGAEAEAAGAVVAAKAPMLKAEAMTATMRVFK